MCFIQGSIQEAEPLLGSLLGPHPSRPRSAADRGEGEHMEVGASGERDSPTHPSTSEDTVDPQHSDLDRISSSTSSLSLSSECVCVASKLCYL